jgi:hypothetical protein
MKYALIKRGTALEGFNRLREYFVNLHEHFVSSNGHVSTYHDVFNSKGAFEKFKTRVEVADNYDPVKIQKMLANNLWKTIYIEAHLHLGTFAVEQSGLHVGLSIEPLERFLLFPSFNDFTILTISVSSSDVRKERHKSFLSDLLVVIDCFQPHYGYNESDSTVDPRIGFLVKEFSEKRTKLRNFRTNPIKFYQPTLIFGKSLTEIVGREHLLKSRATHVYTTAHCIILCSSAGLFNDGGFMSLKKHYDTYEIHLSKHLDLHSELS